MKYPAGGLASRIDTALGLTPADVVLVGGEVVDVFTGEIIRADVAIKDGYIVGVGEYQEGREMVDVTGRYLLPGFIDAHIHIESSMLTPPAFARVVVPRGTTAVVADPHEIVNVAGIEGLRYMVEASRKLPVAFFFMIPSCVPSTPLETAGAEIGPEEIEQGFDLHPESPGLAEMMNFPGVLRKSPEVLRKIATARDRGRLIDGHAPGLSGRELNAYIGAGITTDHETTSPSEALEKLRLGMHLIIREGSAAKNLEALLPVINEHTYPFISFGCDDRHTGDLLAEGEMDHIIRRAVALGLPPVQAVRMATLNTARYYGLKNRGAIAPGYVADVVVVDNLSDFTAERVYSRGRLVACEGQLVAELPVVQDSKLFRTVRIPDLRGRLTLTVPSASAKARVIEVIPDQIVTGSITVPASQAGPDNDILYVAVVERHGKNGNVSLGLVKGFGLKRGALASTVAHDSHNLVLVGSSPEDMELAAHAVAELGGGLAVVAQGRVLGSLALPVGGLMSDQDAGSVSRGLERLHRLARELGSTLPSPFMTMSFLALAVIPELKITDKGLVDVGSFALVDLWVEK